MLFKFKAAPKDFFQLPADQAIRQSKDWDPGIVNFFRARKLCAKKITMPPYFLYLEAMLSNDYNDRTPVLYVAFFDFYKFPGLLSFDLLNYDLSHKNI